MIEKNYYSLRLLGSNPYHADGDVLKTTNKVLHIGETADCGIRFSSGEYVPERYASIVENEDGKSWRLIQRSPHVMAKIAGSGGFGYVHQLKDGDVIMFDGQDIELEFHTHFDGNYGKEGFVIEHVVIEQHSNKKSWIMPLTGIVIAALIAVLLVLFPRDINYNDLKDSYEKSVYLIRVDSVQWIEVYQGDTTLVKPTKVLYSGSPVGTAFLTTNGKLITARHCIEYWIGEEADDIMGLRELEDIKTWAVMAETFSYERELHEPKQLLRVFFSIHTANEADKTVFAFSSTDPRVHINRFHDGHKEFGDHANLYFWRTIQPTPNDPERELGDIVYIDVDTTGTIALADSAMIAGLNPSTKIGILGLPANLTGRHLVFSNGSITEDRSDTTIIPNPNIQFEANIAKGFSGGPVFIKSGKKVVAIGVVSKIDTDNGIYKKAVPVTEIEHMMKREKEGTDD